MTTPFNAGSDARLAGKSLSSCPYDVGDGNKEARTEWCRGWRDVQANWPHRLPVVEETLDELRRRIGLVG